MDKRKMIAGFLSALLLALPLMAMTVSADTSYVTATVGKYCAQTLSADYGTNVTFGSVTHNTLNNNATGNGIGTGASMYNVTTSSNTNCNITWSAIDFTSGANIIGKDNLSMNVTESPSYPSGVGTASTTFATAIEVGNLDSGSVMYSNFFLDVPNLQAEGTYVSNLTITIAEL